MEGLLGRKLGMTQVFDQTGNRVVVTVVELGPCHVVQRFDTDDPERARVQLAFDEAKQKALNRPKVGLFEKKGLKPHRVLKEFRVGHSIESYEEGKELRVEAMFTQGEYVDVAGLTKGRGFTGVMKRHGYHGSKASHGVHEYFRHGGSIGCSADPARVFKGKKMPGQYGNDRITVQNLQVVLIVPDKNLMLIKGALPGPKQGLLEVCRAKKKNARVSEVI